MSSRTFLLFILAVLLPGGALAVVGVLLVNQQQEVLALREQDGRSLAALERDYASLANSTSDRAQQSYLEIQHSRILQNMGTNAEARPILTRIVELGIGDVDEFGIPLSLYARALMGDDAPAFQSDEWLNYETHAFSSDIDRAVSRDEYKLLRHAQRVAPGLTGWTVDPDSTWACRPFEFDDRRISSLAGIVADVALVERITDRLAGDSQSLGTPFPMRPAD